MPMLARIAAALLAALAAEIVGPVDGTNPSRTDDTNRPAESKREIPMGAPAASRSVTSSRARPVVGSVTCSTLRLAGIGSPRRVSALAVRAIAERAEAGAGATRFGVDLPTTAASGPG